ncbi:unnamed protein product [Medioppia subpectinata]|uniref:Distal membrane arm assembly complex 2-like protein n=1 Tax=Medioppia subpectinata TaxID=1979941 RepID=A0A7R9KN97_9ACAR|nr:unnamed protein product [Medioppia subpectinata]CAG2106660.1 unnamed protein product [Medioppia subpectinata]
MLRKCVHAFQWRHLTTSQRLLSSQIIAKTSDQLVPKSEVSSLGGSETSDENKGLAEYERQELAKVIKSPVQLDSYWETKIEEKLPKRVSYFDRSGGLSVDLLNFMHYKYDISLQGLKRRLRFWIQVREQYNQRYIARRHAILGPELATAHFVVYRGGRAKFTHTPNTWITKCEQMPNVYDSRFRLIELDASNVKLRYESFDNFSLLNSLQELNLSKNKLLDDFMCDKLARLFRNSNTLTVLDLSDNPLISHRGIETLHRIKSLRKLVITGTKAAKYPFIDLLIILFTDVNPNCEIVI